MNSCSRDGVFSYFIVFFATTLGVYDGLGSFLALGPCSGRLGRVGRGRSGRAFGLVYCSTDEKEWDDGVSSAALVNRFRPCFAPFRTSRGRGVAAVPSYLQQVLRLVAPFNFYPLSLGASVPVVFRTDGTKEFHSRTNGCLAR